MAKKLDVRWRDGFVNYFARFVDMTVQGHLGIVQIRPHLPMRILKLFLPLVVFGFSIVLPGCAQTGSDVSTSSDTSSGTTQKVEKGAEAAARFAVGHVLGTPAKVAMAASTVAGKVAKKAEGDTAETQTPAN